MKPIHIFLILLLFSPMFFVSCNPKEQQIERPEFKKFYDEFGVAGSFVLFDEQDLVRVQSGSAQSAIYTRFYL
jgi:hypothetical protein